MMMMNKFNCCFQHGQSCVLAGEISPDKSKCLIRAPLVSHPSAPAAARRTASTFSLYDLKSKTAAHVSEAACPESHFCFDPRFSWRRIAVANFLPRQVCMLLPLLLVIFFVFVLKALLMPQVMFLTFVVKSPWCSLAYEHY